MPTRAELDRGDHMSLLDARNNVKRRIQEHQNIKRVIAPSKIAELQLSISQLSQRVKDCKERELILFTAVSNDKNVKLLSSLLNNFLKVGNYYTFEQLSLIYNQISTITKTNWSKFNLSKWGSNKVAICTQYKSIRPALILEQTDNGVVLKKITYFLCEDSVLGL